MPGMISDSQVNGAIGAVYPNVMCAAPPGELGGIFGGMLGGKVGGKFGGGAGGGGAAAWDGGGGKYGSD